MSTRPFLLLVAAWLLLASCGEQSPYGCEETVTPSKGIYRLSGRYYAHRTDIYIKKFDRIRLSATGEINLGNSIYDTPAGNTPGADGLYLRIGATAIPLFVGEQKYFAAADSGALYLITPESDKNGIDGCMEQYFMDNTGWFDVTVEINPGL